MTDTNPRDLIRQLADLARRKHYTCEDSWYSCPQSGDGSANKHAGTECDCGATKHNAKVDAICTALTQPEPEGLTDENAPDFDSIFHKHAGHQTQHFMPLMDIQEFSEASSEVLARWGRPRPSIEPVPVSERPWEREGWCDGDGWCWWFDADGSDPCWVFDQPQFVIWTHCLPAHALPLPVNPAQLITLRTLLTEKPMTQQHNITPPPELVQQLYGLPQMKAIEKAFEAGADQELEACCEWTTDYFGESFVANLRAARRPKPKSEKQQALDAFDRIEYAPSEAEDFATIRRAIESIPDDQ